MAQVASALAWGASGRPFKSGRPDHFNKWISLDHSQLSDLGRLHNKRHADKETGNMKPKILITNDDGINSDGIKALENILRSVGNIYVAAPSQERSAAAHSISFNHPLRIHALDKNRVAVDGTPTDCVMYGVYGLLNHKKPDLVVSGINKGANLGDDITYSGTVSAAMEGTLLGIPSIAISVVNKGKYNYDLLKCFIRNLSKNIIKRGLPKNTFLNINIPDSKRIKGVMIVRQGKRIYKDKMIKKIDPRGRSYYWLGGKEPSYIKEANTDFYAIEHNMIAITPLHFDLTNHSALRSLKYLENL